MAIKVHYFIYIDPSKFNEVINILTNIHKLNVNPAVDIENQKREYISCWKIFPNNDYTEVINKMRNIGQI